MSRAATVDDESILAPDEHVLIEASASASSLKDSRRDGLPPRTAWTCTGGSAWPASTSRRAASSAEAFPSTHGSAGSSTKACPAV